MVRSRLVYGRGHQDPPPPHPPPPPRVGSRLSPSVHVPGRLTQVVTHRTPLRHHRHLHHHHLHPRYIPLHWLCIQLLPKFQHKPKQSTLKTSGGQLRNFWMTLFCTYWHSRFRNNLHHQDPHLKRKRLSCDKVSSARVKGRLNEVELPALPFKSSASAL